MVFIFLSGMLKAILEVACIEALYSRPQTESSVTITELNTTIHYSKVLTDHLHFFKQAIFEVN